MCGINFVEFTYKLYHRLESIEDIELLWCHWKIQIKIFVLIYSTIHKKNTCTTININWLSTLIRLMLWMEHNHQLTQIDSN